jgi:hypothetical protein
MLGLSYSELAQVPQKPPGSSSENVRFRYGREELVIVRIYSPLSWVQRFRVTDLRGN